MRIPRLLLASVGLLSAAAIGYEILLMRLFSIVQWHHFAYMIISLALLGYGASGTFLTLARRLLVPRFALAYPVAAALFGVTAVAAFAAAQRLPFNALEVAWDPRQLAALSAVYLVLAVPFFCAASAIGLALMRHRGGVGRLYGADLSGAGVGAAGVVALLFLLPPERCLTALGGCGLAAAAVAAAGGGGGRRRRGWGVLLLGLGVAAASTVAWPRSWIEPRLSPYKGLSMALQVPGVEVVAERSSPLGSLTVVASRQIPLRHAPGLSLAAPHGPPAQLGLFTDGDSLSALDHFEGDLEAVAYRDYLTSALPYHLLDRPRVLVLGAGGGAEVLTALYHRAARIDAVELNPQVVELVTRRFGAFTGLGWESPRVHFHVGEGRGFVARAGSGGGQRAWDLIQVSLLDSFTASAAGVHALSESHLYTVESFATFLEHLRPGGLLAVTRWLEVPPRSSLKLVATAAAALERLGVEEPAARVVVIRSWKTATLLVKEGPFTADELAAVRSFCEPRLFDLGYVPGMEREEANRFNLWQEPTLFDGARALLGPARRELLRRYKFHVAPATDDRPYFFRFFRWRALPELVSLAGRGGTPMLEWGYLVLVATLVQAVVAAGVLILAPLAFFRRHRWERRRSVRRRAVSVSAYFLCLGLAFLGVEIAFIQRFTLFLSHPLYAVAVVLAGFLLFAGLGSATSSRLARRLAKGRAGTRAGLDATVAAAVTAVVALSLLYTGLLPPLAAHLVGWAQGAKVALAMGLVAPLAFCMGMPFPLGLVRVARRERRWVPWAWAVNGCASVVGAVGAALMAVHLGFTAVVVASSALYAVAALVLRRV